jgi:arylsulfatase A-like enzyme
MIEKVDDALGRLLARLDDPNGDGDPQDSVRANTIIVFTSDNGGVWDPTRAPGANPAPPRSGKCSLYEGGIRVPLIVSFEGDPNMPGAARPARRSNARTSSHDIHPTLLDLAGVGEWKGRGRGVVDGVSLRPSLEGQAFDRGDQFWHYPHESPAGRMQANFTAGRFTSAVRRGHSKLLYFWEDRRYELYDLDADPGETTDLAASRPEAVADLAAALSRWLVETGAQLPIERATNAPAPYPQPPASAVR